MKKDIGPCKEWLKSTHPIMFQELYPEGDGGKEGEEKKQAQQQKKKKQVGFAKAPPGEIKVYKIRRGGKKITSMIVGLEGYNVNLKDTSKVMQKKWGCGVAVSNEPAHGNVIQVQGDLEDDDKLRQFLANDMPELGISPEKVVFEGKGKK
mmetsp:Transcript_8117/g.7561  ORF Transcript_8117/g.7561 Transcript_8117/m.7561 type:complete len:150 (+) Transcript_8117:633-1082(+)